MRLSERVRAMVRALPSSMARNVLAGIADEIAALEHENKSLRMNCAAYAEGAERDFRHIAALEAECGILRHQVAGLSAGVVEAARLINERTKEGAAALEGQPDLRTEIPSRAAPDSGGADV